MKPLHWTNGQARIGDLIDYSKNPVQISERAAKKLAAQLKRGQDLPYVIAAPLNGHKKLPLLDGHQRKAVEFGINKIDPNTMVRIIYPNRALTDKEKQQWIIEHRKNTGDFDFDILANNFNVPDLLDWGFTEKELQLGGFEFEDATQDAEPQIDRAAELLKKWKCRTGDLYAIGEHRLLVGDSTKREDVERVMGGERAGITFTSPPYNVAANSNLPNKDKYSQDEDNKSSLEYVAFLTDFTALSLLHSEYVFVNVQSVSGNKAGLIEYLYCLRDRYADTIIWDKETAEPAMAKNVLNSRYEYVHIFSNEATRKIGTKEFRGTVANVLSMNSRRDKEFSDTHKATFPADFAAFFVDNFTNSAECVLEPFTGTGTTLVACQNLGRKGRGIEISPAYVAVTLERMATAFPELEIKRLSGV